MLGAVTKGFRGTGGGRPLPVLSLAVLALCLMTPAARGQRVIKLRSEFTDGVNATILAAANTLDGASAKQGVTATTVTAVTNAKAPTMPNNGTTAAATVGGILSARCKMIWNQAAGGAVQFATSPRITPTASGTTCLSDFWLSVNPGTTSNVSVQIYDVTSSGSDTLTVEPGTGCSGWQ
jgi:hypothetical protein